VCIRPNSKNSRSKPAYRGSGLDAFSVYRSAVRQARAEQVAEEICQLRCASISELYRSEALGEKETLPPGLSG